MKVLKDSGAEVEGAAVLKKPIYHPYNESKKKQKTQLLSKRVP